MPVCFCLATHRRAIQRPLVLSLLVAIGGCASQTEMARLQEQVVDLRKQLAYEKQRQATQMERLKRANGQAGSDADQDQRH